MTAVTKRNQQLKQTNKSTEAKIFIYPLLHEINIKNQNIYKGKLLLV